MYIYIYIYLLHKQRSKFLRLLKPCVHFKDAKKPQTPEQ